MVRWAAMSARKARPEEERAAFFIDGQRFEGRPGESLMAALVRMESDEPGLLARLTDAPGTDWRGVQDFARFETILDSGEKASASPAHFTVRAGQRFRRPPARESASLANDRSIRLTNWLRRYVHSLRKSVERDVEEKPAEASPLERLTTEIAVIGGGAWGRSMAQKLAGAGRKVVLVHAGALDGVGTEGPTLLPDAEVIAAAADGEIWIEQRVGYERLKSISLKANLIVFATGSYERPLPMPGLQTKGVMPLGLVARLFMESGYLPGGKVVAALDNEGAFTRTLALQEAGMNLALIIDARAREDQPSLDRAMVAGVRTASSSAPLAAEPHEKALRLKIGSPFVEEDKFAREEECDVLLLSGGAEPRLAPFLQAGGRLVEGWPVATRTAQGVWLVPVGSLAGTRGFSAREAGEKAADITVLALNRNREAASLPSPQRQPRGSTEEARVRGNLGYGEGLTAEELEAINKRAGGHGGLAALEVKLRHDLAAAATAPSFLLAAGLPVEPLFRGLRSRRGVRLSPPASGQESLSAHWLAGAYGPGVKWKKMAGRPIPHRRKEPQNEGFLDVTGLMTTGKSHPDLAILALGAELPDEIAAHFSRPKRLGAGSPFVLYSARGVAAAEKVKRGWKPALPLITFEDAIRVALESRTEPLFQMLGESVYGLAPRPVAFYGQSGHAGLPQPGERFFATAHTREPIGVVLASAAASGLMAVHAIGDRLPDELYSPVFKHSFRKLPDQP